MIRQEDATVLKAIALLRSEFSKAHQKGENWLVLGEILYRLGTLYSCLDVEGILKRVHNSEMREKAIEAAQKKTVTRTMEKVA